MLPNQPTQNTRESLLTCLVGFPISFRHNMLEENCKIDKTTSFHVVFNSLSTHHSVA